MQIVVVQNKITNEIIPFTVSLLGEIIITVSGVDIDNLIVKAIDYKNVSNSWLEENQDYYIFLKDM